MADCRILTGELSNLLARGAVTVTASEDSRFPASKLYDGRTSSEFRPSTTATPNQIDIDAELITTPDMDDASSSGGVTGWSGSTEATITHTTDDYLELSTTGDASSAYQLIDAKSGETLRCRVRARNTPLSGGNIMCLVRNDDTGNFLTTTGGWTSAWGSAQLITTTATSWEEVDLSFTVEDFATCQKDKTTLRTWIYAPLASTTAHVDYFHLWPSSVDLCSIHGHNLPPDFAVSLIGSSDNYTTETTVGTFTVAQPSFYLHLSTGEDYRYWRVEASRTWHSNINTSAIRLGELVLGESFALGRFFQYGSELRWLEDIESAPTGSGEKWAYALGQQPRRVFAASWQHDTTGNYEEFRDEVFRRSRGSVHPMVIVPDTDQPDVIHGRIDNSWGARRVLMNFYEDSALVVTESPFSVKVST